MATEESTNAVLPILGLPGASLTLIVVLISSLVTAAVMLGVWGNRMDDLTAMQIELRQQHARDMEDLEAALMTLTIQTTDTSAGLQELTTQTQTYQRFDQERLNRLEQRIQ